MSTLSWFRAIQMPRSLFSITDRPDRVGSEAALSRDERSEYRWFNPSAFAAPTPFTFGNSASNLLFTPGDIVFDFSALKDFLIKERFKVQFRTEFFNLPNHRNLGGPGTNISVPASVGRITSAGEMRQIQFGAKVLF